MDMLRSDEVLGYWINLTADRLRTNDCCSHYLLNTSANTPAFMLDIAL
jgi:hypothetical protein